MSAPVIVDSHVHLMPDRLARAIRKFFDQHIGDQLVYESDAGHVLDRHADDGVAAVWNLPYAHKPDMSEQLNAGMAEVTERFAGHAVKLITGCTAHPGDESPGDTIRRAFDVHGARVVKLHCSVGGFAADDTALDSIYSAAGDLSMPVVVHVGHDVTGHTHEHEMATIANAAARHGDTTIIVAHCGHSGFAETLRLMDELPNLWADLTPVVFERPGLNADQVAQYGNRLLLGSDAPNVGMTLDSHLDWLTDLGLEEATRDAVMGQNANRLVPIV